MALIEVEDVHKTYKLGETNIEAIRGVTLQIESADFLSIVGPSGCGKTTLLNMIGCIDTATSGSVQFDGTNVAELSDAKGAELRLRDIGFIFQSFNLVPVLSVRENVELPMVLKGTSKERRKETVDRLIDSVGLERFASHKPSELSGGQRQRVAIARALVNGPRLVIADEPTANLDSKTGQEVLSVMRDLNRQEGVTFLFSTHDSTVLQYANRVVRLKDGLVEAEE